ncbi:hypothetical protein F4802DRAFT_254562 [Xylaria palmicola]|nr:hypothetical protein F4802DRAFT_254562 [Xylaria palmicola]
MPTTYDWDWDDGRPGLPGSHGIRSRVCSNSNVPAPCPARGNARDMGRNGKRPSASRGRPIFSDVSQTATHSQPTTSNFLGALKGGYRPVSRLAEALNRAQPYACYVLPGRTHTTTTTYYLIGMRHMSRECGDRDRERGSAGWTFSHLRRAANRRPAMRFETVINVYQSANRTCRVMPHVVTITPAHSHLPAGGEKPCHRA